MTKEEFLKDYLASRIISFDKIVDQYGKIYYKTTEDLIDTCLSVDFQGKDVLSVMASGDHVFTSRLLDAKKTDAFDFNRLTKYYFYLRLWSIEYRKELYPKIMNGDNTWLKKLLKMVKPRNEEESSALCFFQKHVKEDTQLNRLFFDIDRNPEGKVLYETPQELEDCLSPELEFFPISLFQDFLLESTYDIVLISNILEWARSDPKKIQTACDNLSRLVRKDGVVICSKLIDRSRESIELERKIFQENFEYQKTKSGYLYIRKN